MSCLVILLAPPLLKRVLGRSFAHTHTLSPLFPFFPRVTFGYDDDDDGLNCRDNGMERGIRNKIHEVEERKVFLTSGCFFLFKIRFRKFDFFTKAILL